MEINASRKEEIRRKIKTGKNKDRKKKAPPQYTFTKIVRIDGIDGIRHANCVRGFVCA